LQLQRSLGATRQSAEKQNTKKMACEKLQKNFGKGKETHSFTTRWLGKSHNSLNLKSASFSLIKLIVTFFDLTLFIET